MAGSGIWPHLHINTRDDSALARERGLGIEVVDYLLPQSLADSVTERTVSDKLDGIGRRILHGPIATSDTLAYSVDRGMLDAAFRLAQRHDIDRIVLHSGLLPGHQRDGHIVAGGARAWTEFMADKPATLRVCIENVCEDKPELLVQLVDAIGDARVSACLDIGHARVNSPQPLAEWISTLGPRIGHVHLHNNDGNADRHWPLGRGVIDMKQTIDLLMAQAPNATYTLECDAVQSLAWLDEHRI